MKLLALFLLPAVSGFASVINGGFETGTLSGWSALGNVTVTTSFAGINPQAGTFQAILSTGTGSVSAAQAEVFLGLPAGALGLAGAQISVLQQFTGVTSDTTFNFYEDFLTNEARTSNPGPGAHALAEALFISQGSSDGVSLGDTGCVCLSPGTHGFAFESGYFSPNAGTGFNGFLFPPPFPTTIAFIVADFGDSTGAFHSTSLLLDSVSTSSIPEPSTAFLLVCGLALFASNAYVRKWGPRL